MARRSGGVLERLGSYLEMRVLAAQHHAVGGYRLSTAERAAVGEVGLPAESQTLVAGRAFS